VDADKNQLELAEIYYDDHIMILIVTPFIKKTFSPQNFDWNFPHNNKVWLLDDLSCAGMNSIFGKISPNLLQIA
jgi:hypothetical protein